MTQSAATGGDPDIVPAPKECKARKKQQPCTKAVAEKIIQPYLQTVQSSNNIYDGNCEGFARQLSIELSAADCHGQVIGVETRGTAPPHDRMTSDIIL